MQPILIAQIKEGRRNNLNSYNTEIKQKQEKKQDNIIEIEDLKVTFSTERGTVQAVNGVSFSLPRGEVVGIVGESGCGKTVTALSVIQLVSQPPGKIENGKIIYYSPKKQPINILNLDPKEKKMNKLRGKEISMIFQEPMKSLNPVYSVGKQIIEKILIHEDITKSEAKEKAITLLEKVEIPSARQRIDEAPHQWSGGMRQRVVIAIALACNPSLVIADEPTTALDVTVQAQILTLMKDLRRDFNTTIMLITHDLGVIGEMADRVVVMYLGKVVEKNRVEGIYSNPAHPYTRGLLKSIPLIGSSGKTGLDPIKGSVPEPYNLPLGCVFAPRCPEVMEKCKRDKPHLFDLGVEHRVRCWLYEGDKIERN